MLIKATSNFHRLNKQNISLSSSKYPSTLYCNINYKESNTPKSSPIVKHNRISKVERNRMSKVERNRTSKVEHNSTLLIQTSNYITAKTNNNNFINKSIPASTPSATTIYFNQNHQHLQVIQSKHKQNKKIC